MALKLWNGSSWTSANGLKVWNGSSWISAQTGRFWNGTAWQIFYNASNPLYLPPALQALVTDETSPFYGFGRVIVDVDGILTFRTGNNNDPDTVSTYTWKLSGAASDYEVKMTSSSGSGSWNTGITDEWLNITSGRSWEVAVSSAVSEYNIDSILYIRKISNLFTVSCPVQITITLGAV